jgi:hypothetical protein
MTVEFSKRRACWVFQVQHAYLKGCYAYNFFTITFHSSFGASAFTLSFLSSRPYTMDGGARRRGPRRVPAPQPPPGSRQSNRLRDRVGVARANPPAPIRRIVISDSSSVNRFSESFGHSDGDSDPFFAPGAVPVPPGEEEVAAPPNPAGEGKTLPPTPAATGSRGVTMALLLPTWVEPSARWSRGRLLTPFRRRGPAGSGLGPPPHSIRQGAMTSTREEGLVAWRTGWLAWRRRLAVSKGHSLRYARDCALGAWHWGPSLGGGSTSLVVIPLLTRTRAEVVPLLHSLSFFFFFFFFWFL